MATPSLSKRFVSNYLIPTWQGAQLGIARFNCAIPRIRHNAQPSRVMGEKGGVVMDKSGLGAKGIVIASVGAGAPNGLDKELEEIIKKGSAVVVQSSRVGEGRIVRGNNWYESGMVVADNLSPTESGPAPDPCFDQDVERGRDPANVRRVLSRSPEPVPSCMAAGSMTLSTGSMTVSTVDRVRPWASLCAFRLAPGY
jgi:hypothetical protein